MSFGTRNWRCKMYYPYLRGRQNELLCLRELLEAKKLSKCVTPVLEPVKFSSTFVSTLKKFAENERQIILIMNPAVGKFEDEFQKAIVDSKKADTDEKRTKLKKLLDEYDSILKDKHICKAYLVDAETIDKVLKMSEAEREKLYLLNQNRGHDEFYIEHGNELLVEASFIPKDEDFKDEVVGNAIILEDCYQKAKRNADYIDEPDVFFSKNHLVYARRGYQGFSDYSIVGNEYDESGFAPVAIAVHIVYLGERKELRVHHFVSDSNRGYSDVPRKFEEAMDKLVEWDKLDQIRRTRGGRSLINYYENGRFPGLGVIKKYSLMHHLELMGDFLEENI